MKKYLFDQPIFIFSLVLTLIVAATEAPLWIWPLVAILFAWKWIIEKHGFFKPSRRVTSFLSVLLLLQVFLQYRAIFTQEASNALLIGLSALKVLDYENERDHQFLILLGFMMVSMKFIFNIDLYWLLPSGLSFIGFWYSLLQPAHAQKLKFLVRMAFVSLPLTFLLFFAFPRFVVPWAVSRSTPLNQVGFSDHLNPGGVAELAQGDQLAFRAQFFNKIQITNGLYWRGNVLTVSEGLRWLASPQRRDRREYQRSAGEFSYEVVLEPGSKGYLFTLDQAKAVTSQTMRVQRYNHSVFRSLDSLNRPLAYTVTSDEEQKDHSPPERIFLQTSSLPPRTSEWVGAVKLRHHSLHDRLKELKKLFSDSRFVYTLRPGTYHHQDLDEFLFERRKGFCEHFAGAYATLARALEIPSRVVTGYHGGTFNVFGNFWRVSQRDAHAWVEVYIDDAWQRIDPTAWIAPLRLSLGGSAFFSLTEDEQLSLARSSLGRKSDVFEGSILEAFVLAMDHLNYRWTHFMLDFDSSSQRKFWAQLTKELSLFVATVLLLVFFCRHLVRRFLNWSDPRTPIEKLLDQTIEWGEARGISYERNHSPLVYLKKLEGAFPPYAPVFRRIWHLYDEEIYGLQSPSKAELEKLMRSWANLRATPPYKF